LILWLLPLCCEGRKGICPVLYLINIWQERGKYMDSEKKYNIPRNLLYSDEHQWLYQEGDIATIGITDYAQSELGDIVFIELPEVGEEIVQGEPFGNIEAIKTVSELFAPVSGEVLEVNESLADDPTQINKDPYGDGWMIKVQIHDLEELEALMPAEDYESLISG